MRKQPDFFEGSKEAPPGPFKKAADDYCEYHATVRRKKGTDISDEVYQVGRTHHSSQEKYRRGWDRIWGDKDECDDKPVLDPSKTE